MGVLFYYIDRTNMCIAIIAGAAVFWLASCLLLRKGQPKRVAFYKTNSTQTKYCKEVSKKRLM